MKFIHLVLIVLVLFSSPLQAQVKKANSYYDSIIESQMNRRTPLPTVSTPTTKKAKTNQSEAKISTSSNNTNIAHARATRDSIIRNANNGTTAFIKEGVPYPSVLWYGNSFITTKVRVKNLPLDSLPDEISLRLIRNEEEFCFPTEGTRSSQYGWRWNRAHRGVDIALKTGEPVYAVFPGVVRVATVMGGYGNCVVIRHYNGLETLYAHLSKIKVQPRQVVEAGTCIGLGGSTGHSTGPHLHFETRFLYESFDPEWVIDIEKKALRTRTLHLDKTYFGVHAPRGRSEPEYKADKSYVQEKPKRQRTGPTYYTSQYGDTYEILAQRYNTTPEQLRQYNPDAPKKLKPGIKLIVRP